jgi:hypothetical protein
MNVTVQAIQISSEKDSVQVSLVVGEQKSTFAFTVHESAIGTQKVKILNYEQRFWDVFKFNQHIVFQVTNLVKRQLAGEDMSLPVEMGQFFAPDPGLTVLEQGWSVPSEVL